MVIQQVVLVLVVIEHLFQVEQKLQLKLEIQLLQLEAVEQDMLIQFLHLHMEKEHKEFLLVLERFVQ